MQNLVLIAGILATTMSLPLSAQTADATSKDRVYLEQMNQWRKDRETRLKADGGWLSVAGLYWLKEGENPLGTAAANAVVLPAGSAPASVGVVTLH